MSTVGNWIKFTNYENLAKDITKEDFDSLYLIYNFSNDPRIKVHVDCVTGYGLKYSLEIWKHVVWYAKINSPEN